MIRKVRVLLINPPIKTSEVYGEYSAIAPCLPPLGLCYIAAVLLENGYYVEILDGALERISFASIYKKIKRYKPNVIGITSTTNSFFQAKQTIDLCKKADPKVLTVLGGAHVSALPQTTMRECPTLDIGVYGEGEITFLELLKKFSEEKNFLNIRGIVYKKRDKVLINPPREPIKNLDNLPFPARHLLGDLRRYSHTPFRGKKFTLSVITSRGCPFNCSFCDQSVFGKVWRAHSANYVVKEITHLKKKYGVEFISFEDDNFLFSRKRAIQICRGIIDNNLNLEWGCSARVDNIDKELLSQLKKAGCVNIYIGIESGCSRVLRLLNKKVQLRDIVGVVNLIKKAGINAYGSVILGIPSETRIEMEKTISFVQSLPLDGVSWFLYTPYPNTKLARVAPQYGIVSSNWQDYSAHSSRLPYIPYRFTESEMLNIQRRGYIRFYLRPKFILKHLDKVLNPRAFKTGTRVLKNLIWTSVANLKIFDR